MNSPRSVLLLNPPGRLVYIRDYYCSKVSRTGYTFPPIDLLHAGAVFSKRGWRTQAIDAIVQGLDVETTISQIERMAPDAIFVLVGAVSVDEDTEFLELLRRRVPRARLIGSGDVLREHGREWIEAGLLDAAALDFSSQSPVRYAEGETEGLDDLIYRTGDDIVAQPVGKGKVVALGLPPHELFRDFPYRFPFARSRPFASVLTDFGCPYRCSFCVMATLHYHGRPLDEIAREFQHLRSLGIREFALWDQTFAINRARAVDVLALLPDGPDRFSWTCFTRPDCIDLELAKMMAAKGCHTVIMGVETAKATSLESIQKDFTTDVMRTAFPFCREAGLETVATVIVGLPGESEEDIEATIDFVCELDPDYLSVHTAIPRAGTTLRKEMIAGGLISDRLANMDQSGEVVVVPSDTLDRETILALRKRFNRRFYLRPHILFRLFRQNMSNPMRLYEQASEGIKLILRNTG